MTSIVLTSDLHGTLPEIEPCDLLIVAGDVCPDHPIGKKERYTLPDNGSDFQFEFLDGPFREWLREVPAKTIVGIAGNHDFVFEHLRHAIPELYLPWRYLEDTSTEVFGLKIHGTPWVPGLPRWAFYGDDARLRQKARAIPEDTDILITHGPPYGIADTVGPRFGGPKSVGNHTLNPVLDKLKIPTIVCGHIHEAYGAHRLDYGGMLYSVSLNDDNYCPDQPPVKIEEPLTCPPQN